MRRVFCCCVDWGTTSFRLWALAADGEVLAEHRSGFGMSALQPADYPTVLERALAELSIPPHTATIVCGMAGSAQGWREVPYIDLPADLNAIAGAATPAPAGQRDVRILPGLAQRDAGAPDVMRGEETILLGALLEESVQGTICLPGTHSKWARVEAGSVTRFCTAMTGELYALLSNHSTLAHFVAAGGNAVADTPAFSDAVAEAIAAPQRALNLLFSIRAGALLARSAGTEAEAKAGAGAGAHTLSARLSGLLIGMEIAGMKEAGEVGDGASVTLISDGSLAHNYRRALAVAAVEYQFCDATHMVRAGLYHAAQSLWPEELAAQTAEPATAIAGGGATCA